MTFRRCRRRPRGFSFRSRDWLWSRGGDWRLLLPVGAVMGGRVLAVVGHNVVFRVLIYIYYMYLLLLTDLLLVCIDLTAFLVDLISRWKKKSPVSKSPQTKPNQSKRRKRKEKRDVSSVPTLNSSNSAMTSSTASTGAFRRR